MVADAADAAVVAARNVTATVTLKTAKNSRERPVLINDFVVEIRLPSGENKTWLSNGDWPKVTAGQQASGAYRSDAEVYRRRHSQPRRVSEGQIRERIGESI